MIEKLTEPQLLWRIRIITLFFIGALVISGLTAFPLEKELEIICLMLRNNIDEYQSSELYNWFLYLHDGIKQTNLQYPFLGYGTDWLAFAHLVIALLFAGVYYKPVRNIWIVYWAMVACVSIIPLAFICAPLRGIPIFWILVDCSFGVFGMIPLILLVRYINQLAKISGCYVPTKY